MLLDNRCFELHSLRRWGLIQWAAVEQAKTIDPQFQMASSDVSVKTHHQLGIIRSWNVLGAHVQIEQA